MYNQIDKYKTKMYKIIKKYLVKLDKLPISIRLAKFFKKPTIGKWLLIFGICTLSITTLLWSIQGAVLQQNNADQLVNPYLFQNLSTWHGALIPQQHSFLIKWPLFYIIRLFNYSTFSYLALTVLSVLLTVGIFAYILSKIDKRPQVQGAIFLALSSVLLLVPAQPYSGGILPVNMAMLTTRNLEYILYIYAVIFLLKANKLKSRQFLISLGILTILMASDKLFLSISIVASVLALVLYGLRKRWIQVAIYSKWVLLSLVAALLSITILWLISATHLTHITSGSVVGPYSLAGSSAPIALGLFYGIAAIFTNFGANPGYSALEVKQIPHTIFHNLFSFGGIGYLVNLLILVAASTVAITMLWRSLFSNKARTKDIFGHNLTLVMLWSSVAAFGLFIASQHYYVVDARYLTITMFALFIAITYWVSTIRTIKYGRLGLIVIILSISVISGVIGSINTNAQQSKAYDQLKQRNELITKILEKHPVKYLVGDYWRVVPIKKMSDGKQAIVPLQDCTQYRQVLTSKNWQPNLTNTRFAYILTLSGSLTDFPSCNVADPVAAYGLPSSTVLISGTLGKPNELILFYDYGAHHPKKHPITQAQLSAVVTPTSLSSLSNTVCSGPTIMNIVAHQDDDLLFMNPDIYHEIQSGYCIRSVYLTAGDAGMGTAYWLSREAGSEAAYSYMLGSKQHWIERVVELPGGQYVSIDQPYKNTKVSLIFLHLPDGDPMGSGFPTDGSESLAKLYAGNIPNIETVDNQSSYTSDQLVNSLQAIMQTYLPSKIQTQADYVSNNYPDHSDHITTGKFATAARLQFLAKQYDNQVDIPISYYIGYPIHQFAPNVSGSDLTEKENTFFQYGQIDKGTCDSAISCDNNTVYGIYLTREYQDSY